MSAPAIIDKTDHIQNVVLEMDELTAQIKEFKKTIKRTKSPWLKRETHKLLVVAENSLMLLSRLLLAEKELYRIRNGIHLNG